MDKPAIVIIGAGPAGISAALQLNKFGIKPMIFSKKGNGSLLYNAYRVDNYPGFPCGISGKELMGIFNKQINNHCPNIINEEVVKVEYSDGFSISTENFNYYSDYLICASGTIPVLDEKVKISSVAKNNIFYEVKDLFGLESRKIAIIGAGDAAFDYALSLSQKNTVTIFNRSSDISCNQTLHNESLMKTNIQYNPEHALSEVEKSKEGLRLTFLSDSKPIQVFCDYLVFAIGRQPNLQYINIEETQKNKLINERRLFIIGDAANKNFRQTGICVGDGIKTALIINEIIKSKI